MRVCICVFVVLCAKRVFGSQKSFSAIRVWCLAFEDDVKQWKYVSICMALYIYVAHYSCLHFTSKSSKNSGREKIRKIKNFSESFSKLMFENNQKLHDLYKSTVGR